MYVVLKHPPCVSWIVPFCHIGRMLQQLTSILVLSTLYTSRTRLFSPILYVIYSGQRKVLKTEMRLVSGSSRRFKFVGFFRVPSPWVFYAGSAASGLYGFLPSVLSEQHWSAPHGYIASSGQTDATGCGWSYQRSLQVGRFQLQKRFLPQYKERIVFSNPICSR